MSDYWDVPEVPAFSISEHLSQFRSSKPSPSKSETEPDFVRILRNATHKAFSSSKYARNVPVKYEETHIPNVPETVVHLKLLRAFQVMKDAVEASNDPEYNAKSWQVFVTNAVRRFVMMVSALREIDRKQSVRKRDDRVPRGDIRQYIESITYSFDEKEEYGYSIEHDAQAISLFSSFLPPLDVLMVWHAILLNPRMCYDAFMRMRFYKFAAFPFPFEAIDKAIDNNTFVYDPSDRLVNGYYSIVAIEKEYCLSAYHLHTNFSRNSYLVNVYCPICGQIVVKDVPFTNDAHTGFADDTFYARQNAPGCFCGGPTAITHNELRKRQMLADSARSVPMPGVLRVFSSILPNKAQANRKWTVLNSRVAQLIAKTDNSLPLVKFLESIRIYERVSPRVLYVLRGYLNANLIHLTVPRRATDSKDIFELHDDLVGCVIRQTTFTAKMNKHDWLHSPVILESLQESSVRYERFLRLLMTYEDEMLVPTLDIDLVWHTHQLSAYYYVEACRASYNRTVIDHDDKVESSRLDMCFLETSKLYQRKYRQPYSICHCWYCVLVRSNSVSKIRKLFRKGKEEPTKSFYPRGFSHISTHNAIDLWTSSALLTRSSNSGKYARVHGKDYGELPWNRDRSGAVVSYPFFFVVPPYIPIEPMHGGFYGDSLCCTLANSGNCTGVDVKHSGSCGGAGGVCGGGSGGGCGGGNCGGGDSGGGGGSGDGGGGGGCGGGCGGGGGGGCGGGG